MRKLVDRWNTRAVPADKIIIDRKDVPEGLVSDVKFFDYDNLRAPLGTLVKTAALVAKHMEEK